MDLFEKLSFLLKIEDRKNRLLIINFYAARLKEEDYNITGLLVPVLDVPAYITI